VRDALALINETLDEILAEQEGDFDADTRWAVAWFEQQGFNEAEYGQAEILSKAKNTSVAGMVRLEFFTLDRARCGCSSLKNSRRTGTQHRISA
jgi:putative DNA methylase